MLFSCDLALSNKDDNQFFINTSKSFRDGRLDLAPTQQYMSERPHDLVCAIENVYRVLCRVTVVSSRAEALIRVAFVLTILAIVWHVSKDPLFSRLDEAPIGRFMRQVDSQVLRPQCVAVVPYTRGAYSGRARKTLKACSCSIGRSTPSQQLICKVAAGPRRPGKCLHAGRAPAPPSTFLPTASASG